ncbi:MAG: cyclopropane-fatty-acyl-phospholipid synthase [Gammaproteobacteria bacterium]|nr:cyclopropane-fatty-acyl-phospholipid synthase [Gammaproteobacteria bacterium]
MRLVDRLFRDRIKSGSLCLIDHQGNRTTFGNDENPVVVKFNRRGTLFRILRNPHLHLGECYMNGELDIEQGSLTDFLRLLRVNMSDYAGAKGSPLAPVLTSITHSWNTVRASLRNVSFHYNLDDDLYRGFLDQDMHYSCAYFENPDESLEAAQQAKCRHLMNKLCLKPGQRVLDIGSGWGSLAMYLAEHADVHVTGITLSTSQLRVANERAKGRNLGNQVRFLLEDYRDHASQYDAIVSVGMFEHVGKRNFPTYFKRVKELLKDDGIATIHTIGSASEPTPTNPWIKRYIFPGGYIPSLSEIAKTIESNRLFISDIEVWRRHYALTLSAWNERFQVIRDEVKQRQGERFCRLWEFYLCACQTAFEYDSLVVFQMQLAHQNDTVPLTRDYLYRT